MSRQSKISLILGLALLLLASMTFPVAQAQEQPTPTNTPRPTPTNIPPAVNTNPAFHGSIRGFVYTDMNGDGKCVGTGVAGETAVANITIQFVNSDEKVVLTQTTADNGAYELAGAGESYWRVTAQPPAGWVVTSQNPLYAPIYANTPLAADVNFCLQKGTAVAVPLPLILPSTAATTLLPDSGAAGNMASFWLAALGLGLILLGLAIHWRQHRA
ncbi:MAG: hypothetical protein IPM39_19010 [Chloroflexi bacterium]|nr:hypothetical protein [Chloroflexota bacterium]